MGARVLINGTRYKIYYLVLVVLIIVIAAITYIVFTNSI